MTDDVLVLDACTAVDLILGHPATDWISERVRDRRLVVPGHFHAEALNAVGGMARGFKIAVADADRVVRALGRLPVEISDLTGLLHGAWQRRDQHALADALYVELAAQLDTVVVTTDRRLARATAYAVAPPG